MQIQSHTVRTEPEAHISKSEIVHNINGQINGHEIDPETIQCRICLEYA